MVYVYISHSISIYLSYLIYISLLVCIYISLNELEIYTCALFALPDSMGVVYNSIKRTVLHRVDTSLNHFGEGLQYEGRVIMNETMFEKAYTIKEFSDATGVPQNTLRNWEEKLGEAFVVPRDPHENRYYTERHLELIRLIQKWRDSEYELSFTQIKQMLLHMNMAGPKNEMYSAPSGEEGGSNSLVSLSQQNSQSLQLQEVQQLVVNMEERMQQFFGHLDQVLQTHAETTHAFVRQEIETLKSSQSSRDENLIQKIESKFHDKIQEEHREFLSSINSMKDEFRSQVETTTETNKRHLDDLMANTKSEFQQQLEDNMKNWAVISREDLEREENARKKKKKGFFGLFGGESNKKSAALRGAFFVTLFSNKKGSTLRLN